MALQACIQIEGDFMQDSGINSWIFILLYTFVLSHLSRRASLRSRTATAPLRTGLPDMIILKIFV